MHDLEPYIARPVAFIRQVDLEGWRIKVYGISTQAKPLPQDLVSNGIEHALSCLPRPAVTDHRYGVGFMTIHQGTLRNWFLVDWWENVDIMHHRLFSSPLDSPSEIIAESDTSLIACVHELRVVSFESQAWIEAVLCTKEESSFERYLALTFGEAPAPTIQLC